LRTPVNVLFDSFVLQNYNYYNCPALIYKYSFDTQTKILQTAILTIIQK